MSRLRRPGRNRCCVYFSFATLTTVGYGDVVATWSLPQVLAVAEATLGQLYLAILVASLVGMHVQSRRVGPADLETDPRMDRGARPPMHRPRRPGIPSHPGSAS